MMSADSVRKGQTVKVKITKYLDSPMVPAMTGKVAGVSPVGFTLKNAEDGNLYSFKFADTTLL